jgi:hypothetical protein
MHQETSQQGGRAEPKRKPAGGFALVSVTQMMMAWCAFREGHIGLKELRVYFALVEMNARRCRLDDGQTPEFTIEELRKLVGGEGGETLRESLRRLKRVGLVRTLTKEFIELATELDELTFDTTPVQDALDKVPHHYRLVPVPRRIIRLIAGGARRTLIATLLGHMVRCLFYRAGKVHPSGVVKASWVADVFGVSERQVHLQRQHLIELGLLVRLETPQRVLNRHGQWFAFNLDWSPAAPALVGAPGDAVPAKAATVTEPPADSPPAGATPLDGGRGGVAAPPEPSPPLAEIPPQTVTPKGKSEPLREDLKTSKPGSAGPVGDCIHPSEEKILPKPTLHDVRPEDLRDPVRLMTLHGQATAEGAISNSEADRLNFFAAANHARVIGSINPPGLFVRIIRSNLFGFLTQDDEDVARAQIRKVLYPKTAPEQLPRGGPYSAFSSPSQSRPQLSDDARFVRDIVRVLKTKGIPDSSCWRFVNRERPEWTRERWDQALGELNGTSGRALASVCGESQDVQNV